MQNPIPSFLPSFSRLAAATLTVGVLLSVAGVSRATLAEGEQAMQAREFSKAVELLAAEPGDYAAYLAASAHYQLKDYAGAETAAAAMRAAFPESPWEKKALYLQALALVSQNKHQEAEAIYAAEAARIFSGERKQGIARLLIRFADDLSTEPKPGDLDALPADHAKALELYRQVLALEIERPFRDEISFKAAVAQQKLGQHAEAATAFQEYLAAFDPTWAGAVGSAERLRGALRENAVAAGKFRLQARYELVVEQNLLGQFDAARQNAVDLIALLEKEKPDDSTVLADARVQWVASYDQEPIIDQRVEAIRAFLAAHPGHQRAPGFAKQIGALYDGAARPDEAVVAYEEFIAGQNYTFEANDASSTPDPQTGISPAEALQIEKQRALYQIGAIRFNQKNYDDAIAVWSQYVNRHPNGAEWAASQNGIINAEFQLCLDAVADKDELLARQRFDAFLAKYPLDDRARQILFTLGQIHFAKAEELEKATPPDKAAAEARYRQAIEEWLKLSRKYPNTEESSLALYRTGIVQSEKFGQLEDALATFKRLNWGSWAGPAQGRVTLLSEQSLGVATARTFRTNEVAKVKVTVRNIEKLKFSQYALNIESYFRKTHELGRIEHLDIDLIQPDKTWEISLENYAKYRPLEQEIDIPFEGEEAGICLIKVEGGDWSATTLVVRSDIDLILKSSKREALVYVEDQRRGEAVAGARILLSDGARIFGTGETAEDGVYRGRFEELKSVDSLRVLAIAPNGAASNVIALGGLQFSSGLTARGYIYNDKSAYRPGETVRFRGVIREVRDGAYAVPEKREYKLRVTDPGGRLLVESEVVLSDFGTFDSAVDLPEGASLGDYVIQVTEKEGSATYAGGFAVRDFQLQQIELVFEFPQQVYFRGEKVSATLKARYYWGAPAGGQLVNYTLPDGRTLSGTTAVDGTLAIEFDASGFPPGRPLPFQATLPAFNISASDSVFLAQLGYAISLEPDQPLVLADEAFEVKVKTVGPDGKPVGRAATVTVLRQDVRPNDPVLEAVPWINHTPPAYAPVTVEEHKVTTDEKTGEATLTLTLKQGGSYTLRASGQDRFGQTVTGQSRVTISDAEDVDKLRLFADKTTWDVGATIPLRLHSRVEKQRALLTFEGEEILHHEIIAVAKGDNPLEIAVAHAHFPNFRVSVALIDGRDLRAATKRFNVKRELKVTIKPGAEVFAPGAEGRIDLIITDQLGNPVEAELSLALVNEALYGLHPDTTPSIVSFFQEGAERYTEFLLYSTCGFQYTAQSMRRIAEGGEGVEGFQIVVGENAIEQVWSIQNSELSLNRSNSALLMACASNEMSVFNGKAEANTITAGVRFQSQPGAVALQQAAEQIVVSQNSISNGTTQFFQQAGQLDSMNNSAGNAAYDSAAVLEGNLGNVAAPAPSDAGAGVPLKSPPSHSFDQESRWLPSVITDKDGKASATFTLPSTAGQWRLTSRGATVETLVGEGTAKVITRRDFFVDLRLPTELQEGDTMPLLGTVHNMTDFEGQATVALLVEGDAQPFTAEVRVDLKKQASTEFLLPPFTVPFVSALGVTATAKAGEHAATYARVVGVRPWGMEYASHAGGITANGDGVTLELPEGQAYKNRQLVVSLSPSFEQAIIDLALGWNPELFQLGQARVLSCYLNPTPQTPGSQLLAAASALEYARTRHASSEVVESLRSRVASLASSLVVSQAEDGSWAWNLVKDDSNLVSTAAAYWALSAARQAGVPVHPETLAKGEAKLNQIFAELNANDNEGKALLLHALSVNGKADFSNANRLYRERNNLSDAALAYMSATFVRMGRDEFARDLLGILAKNATPDNSGGQAAVYWKGGESRPLMNDRAETTALALWAYAKVNREAAPATGAAAFLLGESARIDRESGSSLGPIVASLAEYYAKGPQQADDFEVAVIVNDKPAFSVTSADLRNTRFFALPGDQIDAAANSVRFEVRGRGEIRYAATLSGFSPDMNDPKSFRTPEIHHRHYYHDKLSYRDVPLDNESTSPVKTLELGQRVRVYVQTSNPHEQNKRYLTWEEPIPAGMLLVEGSARGNFKRVEKVGSRLILHFVPGYVQDVTYELVAHAPGTYRVLPSVLRDATNRGQMRMGLASELTILGPGAKSEDPYEMNHTEHFELATKLFNDGKFDEAQTHLDVLFDNPGYRPVYEKDLARMLLWIHTGREKLDANRTVAMFEILRERHPDLVIPFDKILIVGRAYREIGEFERAWLVSRAAIYSSFLNDARISAVLEDQGQYLGSVKYLENLWREYPDSAEAVGAYFALSQSLFQRAPEARAIALREKRLREKRPVAPEVAGDEEKEDTAGEPEKVAMLKESRRLLHHFLTLYPTDPLADDAAFSEINVFFALKDYPGVVARAEKATARHPESEFRSSFEYMAALGHFWQHDHEAALASARAVADGTSKDRDYARYIVAQIYHAVGKPSEAMEWYAKVKELYPDAGEATAYFEQKKIAMPEVKTFKPGEAVEIDLDYRNIREAAIQVYKVDLLKLYLREKNLSNITQVDLAGIDPEASLTVPLGDGKDYRDKTKTTKLPLEKEGAYLVICRGDNLFTSGLILITPLKLEIQENAAEGSVRVNVRSTLDEGYQSEVEVKVVGSGEETFHSGDTDLRGVYQADGITGNATVLARKGDNQYAFHRGSQFLGTPPAAANAPELPQMQQQLEQEAPSKQQRQLKKSDYLQNINDSNDFIQQGNWKQFDEQRRGDNKGVEVQKAQ